MRLLIVSNLDSKHPFGAFTRPFFLGYHLTEHFELCQIGFDCSAVNYATSRSVKSRGLWSYIREIKECLKDFDPDIIYAHESLPGLAALISLMFSKKRRLVFDFHTFSPFEYWTRLPFSTHPWMELWNFFKTYLVQGILVFSGNPIIVADSTTIQLIRKWYGVSPRKIFPANNGIAQDLLELAKYSAPNPYLALGKVKIAAVVAPKTFQFPSNDMSVEMTIKLAREMEGKFPSIYFVVIGRDLDESDRLLPTNISFTGFLSTRSDFIAHLDYADICLLPFPPHAVAGGARNKALDYFAREKLVVSTREGLRGLEMFQHQNHLLIAKDSITDFAEMAVDAIMNLDQYKPLAKAAYQLSLEQYTWKTISKRVADILMDQVRA